jgi:hypothetical protein
MAPATTILAICLALAAHAHPGSPGNGMREYPARGQDHHLLLLVAEALWGIQYKSDIAGASTSVASSPTPRRAHDGSPTNVVIDGVCHADALTLRSGLTNQLMKLHVIINECCTEMARATVGVVLLPKLAGDIKGFASRALQLSALFDLVTLGRAVWDARPGCIVTEAHALRAIAPPAANRTSTRITVTLPLPAALRVSHTPRESSMVDHGQIMDAIYRSVAPSPALAPAVAQCARAASKQVGADAVVVHMRIESDWYPEYCTWRGKRNGAKLCFSPAEIASKLLSTPGLVGSGVVLMFASDRVAMSFQRPSAEPLAVWPRNVRSVNAGDLRCFDDVRSHTERSAVSFFIASTARAFVGMLASTMSNAIVLTRQLRGETNSSYYYDCTTERALLAPKYAGFGPSARVCYAPLAAPPAAIGPGPAGQ